MILLTHIIIALSSIVYTTLSLFRPSQTKLRISYTLIGATLASGVYLTVLNPVSMLRLCTTGLVYIVIVTAGIVLARKRLALIQVRAAEQSQL